jgi:hypothetical protein
MVNLADILVLGLGTWRLTSLATCEDGPGGIFGKVRHWIGVRYDEKSEPYGLNAVAKGLACFWCASIWFATIVVAAYLLWPKPTYYVCLAFALSGVAILIQKVNDGMG